MTNGHEKSVPNVVAVKPTNKTEDDPSSMAVHWRVGAPTPCGVIAGMSPCTKDEGKPNGRQCMSGADLN